MDEFISNFPTGQSRYIFVICLLIGTFVIFKYCLDKFDEPIAAGDDKAPWNFVMPSLLTSRRQYLIGFAIYCSAILLIFYIVSVLIGPENFFAILRAISAAATQTELPASGTASVSGNGNGLQDFPTFPIVIAFYIVGLNPNLPKALDFELPVRKLAHRLAYIPRNMDRIFDYMRFSQFDQPEEEVKEAYAAAELRRPNIDADDLHTILPALNRAVLLYSKAGALAGDFTLQSAEKLVQLLDLEVFKQYRDEIQNVGVNLQGIDSRLLDVAELDAGERQKAIRTIQRDLSRNLEVLYVIFACASTVRDIGRISDRLRAIGFSTPFPPRNTIPWDPIIRVIAPAAIVLLIAYEIAANTWLGANVQSYIPSTTGGILYVLFTILFVHTVAIGQSLDLRASLMGSDRYFSVGGRGNLLAYAKIFLRCWVVCLLWYLLLWIFNLAAAPLALGPISITAAYVYTYCLWACVPACCGAMTAYAIDRPADTLAQRALSGLLVATGMGLTALGAVQMSPDLAGLFATLIAQHAPPDAAGAAASHAASSAAAAGGGPTPQPKNTDFWYQTFVLVIYGGLGGVIGFGLPAALRRYWRALEEQLPDRISQLRANVLQYFHDVQQFNDWLTTANAGLDKHRPLDLLAEDGGLNRLTAFVSATRRRVLVP